MKFWANNRLIFILFSLVVVFEGCQRREVTWDVDNTIPLFKTDISLDAIDTRYLTNVASDSGYYFSDDNRIYSYRINDLQSSDTGIDAFFNLMTLRLNNQERTSTITLAQINPFFKVLDGQNADIPSQDLSNLDPQTIDVSEFFETATLDSGYLDISIKNELPVNIQLVVFELKNKSDNSVVASDSFRNIPKNGGVSSKSINLRGKTVTKELVGVIKRLTTEASGGPVLIESSKGLNVTLGVRNLKPSRAIAAFPTQTVIDQDEGLTLYMGGAEIKYFKVASGKLKIKISSTIDEDMHMVIALPGAVKDGKSFYQEVTLPGPGGSGVSTTEQVYDMEGYLIDFRGKNPDITDTVNTFHQILKVTLDSSGRKLNVGLSDSIKLQYRIESLKPEYAIGYLGNSLSRVADTTAFEMFKGLSGDLKFKDVKVDFVVRNSIGTDGRFKLNKLSSKNHFTQKSVTLSAPLVGNDILVTKPKFQRGEFTETKVSLDVSNSNIKEFLENLPQYFEYDLETEVSPNGNVNNYQDFVFDESRMDVIMKMTAPISFAMGGLVLRDTQGVDFSKLGDMDRIKSGFLYLDLENWFPMDMSVEFELYDEKMNSLGMLNVNPTTGVKSAVLNSSGYPISGSKSTLKIGLERAQIYRLKKSKFIGIKMNVQGNGKMQKLYNNSKLKMNARMQVEYEMRGK
jgi:hypothetical protein